MFADIHRFAGLPPVVLTQPSISGDNAEMCVGNAALRESLWMYHLSVCSFFPPSCLFSPAALLFPLISCLRFCHATGIACLPRLSHMISWGCTGKQDTLSLHASLSASVLFSPSYPPARPALPPLPFFLHRRISTSRRRCNSDNGTRPGASSQVLHPLSPRPRSRHPVPSSTDMGYRAARTAGRRLRH